MGSESRVGRLPLIERYIVSLSLILFKFPINAATPGPGYTLDRRDDWRTKWKRKRGDS